MSFGSGRVPGGGQRNQAAERLQEVALRCRAEQRRGNPLAHHVPDDDVEAGVPVFEEIVEVAVDSLRRDGERGDADAREICGGWSSSSVCWILKPISTSCSRARASSSCARLRSVMSSEMPTRYFGVPSAPEHRHLDGVEEPQTPMGGLDGFFRDVDHLPAGQHGAVLRLEEARLLLGKEVVVALADRRAAIDAERLFFGPVPADEPQVLGILHEEHDRQVLEHRVEEIAGIFELGGAPGQRLLRPAVLGELPLELRLGLARRRIGGAAATGIRAVQKAVDARRGGERPLHGVGPDRKGCQGDSSVVRWSASPVVRWAAGSSRPPTATRPRADSVASGGAVTTVLWWSAGRRSATVAWRRDPNRRRGRRQRHRPDDRNGRAHQQEREHVERAGQREHQAVAESVVEQVARRAGRTRRRPWPRRSPPGRRPTPTALRGKKSVGRIITSVDHDCCPKKARLKSASAQPTGTCGNEDDRGITAALRPSAILRARFSDRRASTASSTTSRRQGSRSRPRHRESTRRRRPP